MIRIAFLCYQNTAAAQMAEALAERVADGKAQLFAVTVVSVPTASMAIKAMAQRGTDILMRRCRSLSAFQKRSFDLVVALEPEALACCSDLPGRETVIRWNLPECQEPTPDYYAELARLLENRVTILFSEGYIDTIMSLRHNQEIMLDDFPEGIIVHDLNRKICFFNRAAEQITGYRRDEILHRDCHEVFSGGFCAGKCSFCDGKPKNLEKINYTVNLTDRTGQLRKLEMAVSCIRDFHETTQGVLACFRDVTEVSNLRKRLQNMTHFNGIIGQDSQMQALYRLIEDLAGSDCAVLIQGESGTGKELVANAIHGEGARAGKPFISVNCGALPEGVLESELFGHVKGAFTGAVRDKKGRFELADGGTLFLDEVAELPANTQVKLLRVLQEGTFDPVGGEKTIKVDVRIISASNRNLRDMVRKGEFREDLFYRLCVVPVELPALRQRRNDIPLLIDHFIGVYNERNSRQIRLIDAAALELLMDHPWTGNVRELQNAIQYAFVKCKGQVIEADHLPLEIAGRTAQTLAILPARRKRQRKLDLETVREALAKVQGNKAEAARLLGIGRATLYRVMGDHSL